jgi:hypothetical protein
MTDNMIDLETLGVGPNAAILTIGWCNFNAHDPNHTMVSDKIHVDVGSCVSRGMEVDDSTVRWWLTQSDEARGALMTSPPVSIYDALVMFAEQFKGDEYVWGNGANFDVSILESAYKRCGIELPWKFYNVRCYRTMKSLVQIPKVVPTIPHCAAADALAQAVHLQNIYSTLGR